MQFKSENTKDFFNVEIRKYYGMINLKLFDDFDENIILLDRLLNYLKNNNVKWIIFKFKHEITFPDNIVYYKNNNDHICHIVDFKTYYLANLINHLKKNKNVIYIQEKTLDKKDGWIQLIDKKSAKLLKLKNVQIMINELIK